MAAPFKVLGSNALRTVLLACVPEFERVQRVTAAVEFGATNHTLAAMREGATADLIVATSGAIDELTREGKIINGSRTDLAVAGIGACVRAGAPKPDISTVDALKRALLDAKSVAYSKSGQSGIHMAKVIVQLGIADVMNAKTKINPSGLVGELIVRGDAELGFQQISELLAVKDIDLVGPLPDAVQLNSTFAAGVGVDTSHKAEASAFVQLLLTTASARIMRDNGLTPIAC